MQTASISVVAIGTVGTGIAADRHAADGADGIVTPVSHAIDVAATCHTPVRKLRSETLRGFAAPGFDGGAARVLLAHAIGNAAIRSAGSGLDPAYFSATRWNLSGRRRRSWSVGALVDTILLVLRNWAWPGSAWCFIAVSPIVSALVAGIAGFRSSSVRLGGGRSDIVGRGIRSVAAGRVLLTIRPIRILAVRGAIGGRRWCDARQKHYRERGRRKQGIHSGSSADRASDAG